MNRSGKPTGRTASLGILGGTFDPVHRAHLRLARALRDELGLAEVRLMPAGIPPHRAAPAAAAGHRVAMARLAIADEPGLTVDPRETLRATPCYTVETLEELRAELGPDVPVWWLIGGDQLAGFATWHRWRDILALCHLAVAARPGWEPDEASLPPELAERWQARQAIDFANLPPAGRIRALSLSPVDVSATAIRADLAAGGTGLGQLAPAVLDYIRRHRLYQPNKV